jgi:hypothetical protein
MGYYQTPIKGKVFTRESRIAFTTIMITTVFKKRMYRADFHWGLTGYPSMLDTSVHGKSAKEVIAKVEEFFNTKLLPEEIEMVE